VLGGLRHGRTLGSPLAIRIDNSEWPKWTQVMAPDPVEDPEAATTGKGVPELVAAIEAFRAHTAAALGERRRARAEFRVQELMAHRFVQHVHDHVMRAGEFQSLLDRIASRETDPYTGVDDILKRALLPGAGTAEAEASAPRGIDHIGVAVSSLSDALAFYRDALGLRVEAPEEVASQRVRAHFIPVGDSAIELLEATAEDSPIAKYLAKRGPGLHHITLRVDDIRAALAHLKAKGVRLIDETPREGAHGALVAFVHPAGAHGVLVELKQSVDAAR